MGIVGQLDDCRKLEFGDGDRGATYSDFRTRCCEIGCAARKPFFRVTRVSAAKTHRPPSTRAGSKDQTNAPHKLFLPTYKWMLLARVLEDKLASLYRSGKIVGGVYLGRGQEAFSAALAVHLDQAGGDVYAPLIRDMAGRLAFGEALIDPMRTYLGSPLGPMRGRDGNIHRGRPREGMLAMISHLGAMVSVVNGVLLARRLRGISGQVGAACVGDGATSTGSFHEAMNQAAVEKLPLVVAVANNQFAYSTPTDRQYACADLVDRAAGYGVMGYRCDGTNLEECLATFGEAVRRAREGEGPQLVVGTLLRLSGHGEHDDASYVPASVRKSALAADCIELAGQRILERGWASEADLATWKSDVVNQVEEVLEQVAAEPVPDPTGEAWCSLSVRHLCEGNLGA
jgi:pyruvate dehydrogenase E1 component alpha subunit/2-oxoisovalerate dehydrogenase E1 component alpha subunit